MSDKERQAQQLNRINGERCDALLEAVKPIRERMLKGTPGPIRIQLHLSEEGQRTRKGFRRPGRTPDGHPVYMIDGRWNREKHGPSYGVALICAALRSEAEHRFAGTSKRDEKRKALERAGFTYATGEKEPAVSDALAKEVTEAIKALPLPWQGVEAERSKPTTRYAVRCDAGGCDSGGARIPLATRLADALGSRTPGCWFCGADGVVVASIPGADGEPGEWQPVKRKAEGNITEPDGRTSAERTDAPVPVAE